VIASPPEAGVNEYVIEGTRVRPLQVKVALILLLFSPAIGVAAVVGVLSVASSRRVVNTRLETVEATLFVIIRFIEYSVLSVNPVNVAVRELIFPVGTVTPVEGVIVKEYEFPLASPDQTILAEFLLTAERIGPLVGRVGGGFGLMPRIQLLSPSLM